MELYNNNYSNVSLRFVWRPLRIELFIGSLTVTNWQSFRLASISACPSRLSRPQLLFSMIFDPDPTENTIKRDNFSNEL
jgi:hypothetical protein